MLRYLLIDFKIMMRVPLSMFFSIMFPLIMMFIIITSYGNVEIGEGYHLIDKYFLIALGMGVMPLTLISFPIWIANRISDGSIKRLAFLGVKPGLIIASDVIAHICMSFLILLTSFLFAKIVYGIVVPTMSATITFCLQYFLIVVVYLLIGAIFGLVFPNQQILLPLGMTCMFASFLFSGVFSSVDALPEVMQKAAGYMPIKHAMNDFFEIWRGNLILDEKGVIISFAYIVVSVVVLLLVLNIRKNRL